ncbi:methyl-accepting chemotaxis protein [Sphingomonas sp. ASV193]|uniref:methyl-accepting chemotaxis protein n=1 Tax=Sphingomonas sp. ASV193 TaxID=3144405 RepID=UPI0032E8EAC0
MSLAPASRPAAQWLTADERSPAYLLNSGNIAQAVDAFQRNPDLRLLPIVDRAHVPVGAVFEKDVRRLLLNPFGHALLRNPSVNSDLGAFLRHSPVHEFTNDIGELVDHYRRENGREGMVLTWNGKLHATITNRRLLLLAAEHEQTKASRRLAKAERIARAGKLFEAQAAMMSSQMVDLANAVQRLAETTVDRSTIAGNRASSVASAALQTRDSMAVMAGRGRGLADAFSGIEMAVEQSMKTTGEAEHRVSVGSEQARALLVTAQSVDTITALVQQIAGTVNLLSLNATIEAARAGAAGRGFAVVASEIRALSDQAHDATGQISRQIDAIRGAAGSVAADYAAMERDIAALAAQASDIDAAIAREADTTRLIAASVSEASAASLEIEESVSAIVQSVRLAGSSARELDGLANQLRRGATELRDEVSGFLREIQSAQG